MDEDKIYLLIQLHTLLTKIDSVRNKPHNDAIIPERCEDEVEHYAVQLKTRVARIDKLMEQICQANREITDLASSCDVLIKDAEATFFKFYPELVGNGSHYLLEWSTSTFFAVNDIEMKFIKTGGMSLE